MRVTRQSLKSLKPKIKGRETKKVKKESKPDPRMKNYPEDLEGLTEGERKL